MADGAVARVCFDNRDLAIAASSGSIPARINSIAFSTVRKPFAVETTTGQ